MIPLVVSKHRPGEYVISCSNCKAPLGICDMLMLLGGLESIAEVHAPHCPLEPKD